MHAFTNFLSLVIAHGYDLACADHSTWPGEGRAALDKGIIRDRYLDAYCPTWTDALYECLAEMYPDPTVTTDESILF